METVSQLLHRIAVNRLGPKTIGYVHSLEAVADAARRAAATNNLKELDAALANLDTFISEELGDAK